MPSGYGFGACGEKKLRETFSLGGYTRIDRNGLNSDRFPRGKRFHLDGHITISAYWLRAQFRDNHTAIQSNFESMQEGGGGIACID